MTSKSEVQKIRRLFDGIRAMDLTPDDLQKVGKYIDELEAENERLRQLKPCPFCGSDAVAVRDDGDGDCTISCSKDCEAGPCVVMATERFEEAVIIWNRRKEQSGG